MHVRNTEQEWRYFRQDPFTPQSAAGSKQIQARSTQRSCAQYLCFHLFLALNCNRVNSIFFLRGHGVIWKPIISGIVGLKKSLLNFSISPNYALFFSCLCPVSSPGTPFPANLAPMDQEPCRSRSTCPGTNKGKKIGKHIPSPTFTIQCWWTLKYTTFVMKNSWFLVIFFTISVITEDKLFKLRQRFAGWTSCWSCPINLNKSNKRK